MAGPDIALNTWRKSTYSGGGGSECVEVGGTSTTVLVRDTKNRNGAILNLEADAWRRFTAKLKTSA
jgi:hypothetical protein